MEMAIAIRMTVHKYQHIAEEVREVMHTCNAIGNSYTYMYVHTYQHIAVEVKDVMHTCNGNFNSYTYMYVHKYQHVAEEVKEEMHTCNVNGNRYTYEHTYQHIAQEARDEGNVYIGAMQMAIGIRMNKCTSRELNHAKFFFLSHIIYIRLYIQC